MIRMILYFQVILLFVLSNNSVSQSVVPLKAGCVIELAGKEKAMDLIAMEDVYTSGLSKFDLESKVNGSGEATVAGYVSFAQKQVIEWNEKDQALFAVWVPAIAGKMKALGLDLNFPDTIEIIKSTMQEEGGAEGFTRGNCIFLKESLFGARKDETQNILIHEMFHVLSRYNPGLREKIYNSLGFRKCNEVPYPKEIADLKISNPDAPYNNYYITCEYKEKPVQVMFILYSNIPYKGGSFFFYVQIGLLVVEREDNNKVPVYENGKPKILKLDQAAKLFEQIGTNTSYDFHEEEISADHFVMLLNQKKDLPNPELIEAMKKAMLGN